jgi:serine/threonine protein kinase
MNLLGPSLSNTRRQTSDHHFTLETTLRVSIFMFQCLHQFHSHGFVHCDVKPGNFLLNPKSDPPLVLIDFGLSKRYIDPLNGQPFPEQEKPGFRGTAKYSSLSAHRCYDQCPRDDLISWLYSVLELVEGRLPWGSETDTFLIRKYKIAISNSTLLRSFPKEFLEIAKYLDGLKYGSTVNYQFMFDLLLKAVKRKCPDLTIPFDWELTPAAKMREITPITELPAGCDCVKNLGGQQIETEIESSPCSMCEVA